MGTRSFVGVMVGDKCRSIYVHSDGYLEGVGAGLQQYQSQIKVEELISHGDRSFLDGGYYKDNGEDNIDPVEYDTFEEFFNACNNSGGEWYYIFKDSVWYCGNTDAGSPLYKKLTPYIEAVEVYKALEEETI